MTSDTVFVLGRTPELAFAELTHVFPNDQLERIHPQAVSLKKDLKDPLSTIKRLGGTVIIGKSLGIISEITPQTLSPFIAHGSVSSVTFAISTLEGSVIHESFLREIKAELKSMGISSRYIANKKAEPLSAIVTEGQHVEEYVIISNNQGYQLVKTLVGQNIPEWVKRDFDRPYADPKRGMLPPKVACMLVNIISSFITLPSSSTLLDPFCGMGTVLGEGMLSGLNVVGSDISDEVVIKAKGNLSWLQRQYPSISSVFRVMQSDAVHISKVLEPSSVDAVVTEPFMGSPSFALQSAINPEEIRNTVKGLEKLYLGCLKDWYTVLKPKGVILMAFPSFRVNGRELFVKKVIDSCETLGYSISEGPWSYGRPYAVVERNFYLLQKK